MLFEADGTGIREKLKNQTEKCSGNLPLINVKGFMIDVPLVQ